jgi:ParB family chromosome partitioning protein
MIQIVKLAKLVPSNLNVRKTRDEDIEQFAASILAMGVLQNLIVTPLRKPRGACGIVAGYTRYAALMLLDSRGDIVAADYDVPVKLMTGDDLSLSEVSLTENFQRRDMTPADECRAFDLILSQGGDVDGVAKKFGVTRRFVEGRLRLAKLAEPIFEALAEGRITLDLAKAYASTESHDRQLSVWSAYGRMSHYGADSIRRLIANESMKSSDPIAILVGADAYVAAGGVIDRDLFTEAGDKWTKPEVAQHLVAAIMEAEAQRLGTELGLSWIRPIANASSYEATRTLHEVDVPVRPMTEDEHALEARLVERLGEIESEMEAGDLDEEAGAALEAQAEAIDVQLNQLQAGLQVMPPEVASRVGTFLTLSRDGQMVLDDRFYSETPLTITMVEPEPIEGGEITSEGSEGSEAGEGAGAAPVASPTFHIEEGSAPTRGGPTAPVDPDAAAPGGKALSQVLLDQLAVQRRDVLGAALIANPALALDYMLFAMVDGRTMGGSGDGTTISASKPQDPVLSHTVPGSRARDYLAEVHDGLDASWGVPGGKVERFEAFRTLGDDIKAAWLAWIVATSLEAKENYSSHRQNPLQNRLATILEVDVASWWRPTSENFFDRVSKGTLLSLLDDVGGPALSGRHASSKKPEISASCEKLFAGNAIVETEVKEAALAWVPAAMRFNDAASSGEDGDDLEALIDGVGEDENASDDLVSLVGEERPSPEEGEEGTGAGVDDDVEDHQLLAAE